MSQNFPTAVQPRVGATPLVLASLALCGCFAVSAVSAAETSGPVAVPQPTMASPVVAQSADIAVPDVPWVLGADQHPWPLMYRDGTPLSALYVDVPSSADMKLMLPGPAADTADRARYVVGKFITDVIGSASQLRGAELEAVTTWVARTLQQESTLSADPWVQYQFRLEARRQVEGYRASVAAQSAPQTDRLALDLRKTVARVAPMLEVSPTYEIRMAWYNVMVQLKEGMTLYQAQVTNGDQAVLAALDQFLTAHPPLPRPEGPEPAKLQRNVIPAAQPIASTGTDLEATPKREPTKPLPPAQQDTTGGLIVALGLVASVIGFFMYLRKRNKRKPNLSTE